jgi:peptide/nickel transport system substrate-binding protein
MNRNWKGLLATAAVVLVLAAVVGVVVASKQSSPSANGSSTTLSVAESPGTNPSSLLPYYTGAQCYSVNIDYWNLMYRPGYWFGLGNSVTEQPALSSFNPPIVQTSGGETVVTISSKPWKWTHSNGAGSSEVQGARMINFWINMDRAESTPNGGSSLNACGYSPGLGFPDQVKSVTDLNASTVRITFSTTFNSHFLLYNQLSQIQPMPIAWDVTGIGMPPGSGGCSSESFASVKPGGGDNCSKVFKFLSELKLDNPLWDWSDGPYRQSAFGYSGATANGINAQVANTNYSGPVKAHAAKTINFVPFASETSEQAQLQSGNLDIGYLDPTDVSASPGPGRAGSITLPQMTAYTAIGTVDWGVFYWNVNFGTSNSTSPAVCDTRHEWVCELNQTYFRAAIQQSINQAGVISHIDNGYATSDFSAIPTYPANPFGAGVTNPYPFDPTAARALLTAHGWSTSTPAVCESNAQYGCGSSEFPIAKGAVAELTLESPTGDVSAANLVNEEVATIASSGIVVSEINQDQNTVGSVCFAGKSAWELCNYGGWLFAPDYYPSGEVLFLPGAGSNDGGLNDLTMNGLIHDTDFGGIALNAVDPKYGTSYGQYTATSVPFIWQPTPAGFEIRSKSLLGDPVPNPLGDFNPEYITSI